MKRIISLLLAAVMVLSLCACGSSKPQKKSLDELTAEDFQAAAEQLMGEEAETQAPTEAEQKVYKLGETISTMDGLVEITVESAGYTYEMRDGLPCENGQSGNVFIEEGEVIAYARCIVKYVGNEKKDIVVDMQASLDYNDGYSYFLTGWVKNPQKPDNRYHDGTFNFPPLTEDRTMELRAWNRVPKSLESDTESPLLLKLVVLSGVASSHNFPRTEYTIQIR